MRVLAMVLLMALPLPLSAQNAEPADAAGWFQLGVTRHDAGDFRGALAAYQHAEEMGFSRIFALGLRQARAHAKLGEADAAFALLRKLTDRGFDDANQVNAENDFLSIRLDPRYAEAIAAMERNARPCSAPEYRQFDLWLGEWDVESNGRKIARSSVRIILNDCVVFENYQSFQGYAGKSFSLWDAAHKRWEQRYVDTGGTLQEWAGKLENGVMTFHRDSERNGKMQFHRMTYTREGPDRVRQILEVSDDGKSWRQTYNGLYIRRR